MKIFLLLMTIPLLAQIGPGQYPQSPAAAGTCGSLGGALSGTCAAAGFSSNPSFPGNVLIQTTLPGGAPAGSLGVLGDVYASIYHGDGSQLSGITGAVGPLVIAYTTGTGGVAINSLVKLDTDGTVIAVTGTEGILGIAKATKTVGQAVDVTVIGAASCVAEGSITAGHYLIAGTTTPTKCKDSGQTLLSAMSLGTRIVGKSSQSVLDGVTFGLTVIGTYRTGAQVTGADLPATAVQTGQANTYTTGLQDFSSGTVKLPSAVTVGANAITFPGVAATLAILGANTFVGNQTIQGNIIGTVAAGVGVVIPTYAASGSPATAYGLTVAAPTGGTANYAAAFTGGNVGIGTTGPTEQLDVYNGFLGLSYSSIAHGMTDLAPTNTYGLFRPLSGTLGGMLFRGLSNSANGTGLEFEGIIGSNTPTASTPAIVFSASKKSGTANATLDNSATAFQFTNYAANLVTILGSGNVGVGTTGPQTKLDVNGSANIGGGTMDATYGAVIRSPDNTVRTSLKLMPLNETQYLSLGYEGIGQGSAALNIGTLSSNPVQFFTNGSSNTRMVIDNQGNVGIGTTSPGFLLDVAGNARVGVSGGFNTLTVGTAGLFRDSGTGIFDFNNAASTKTYERIDTGNNVFTFFNSDFNVTQTGGASALFMKYSSGNVGIGTTTPGSKLDVWNGGIHIKSSGAFVGLGIEKSSDDSQLFISHDGTEWSFDPNYGTTGAYYPLSFKTNGLSRFMLQTTAQGGGIGIGGSITATTLAGASMVITNGNVGIGTTTPAYGLQAAHSGTAGTVGILDPTASTGSSTLYLGYDNSGTYTGAHTSATMTLLKVYGGQSQTANTGIGWFTNAGVRIGSLPTNAIGLGIILTDSAGACWQIVPSVTTGVVTSTSVACP